MLAADWFQGRVEGNNDLITRCRGADVGDAAGSEQGRDTPH